MKKGLDLEVILKEQSRIMSEYAFKLAFGTERAQCYAISHYKLCDDESIADRLLRDHSSRLGALRAAQMMVEAGCAEEAENENPNLFGTFTFLDGSII